MGVRILLGVYDGTGDAAQAACLVDSVTGTAFGPLFRGPDADLDIERFLKWYDDTRSLDLRRLTAGEIEALVRLWKTAPAEKRRA
jgi:hypothetical protein